MRLDDGYGRIRGTDKADYSTRYSKIDDKVICFELCIPTPDRSKLPFHPLRLDFVYGQLHTREPPVGYGPRNCSKNFRGPREGTIKLRYTLETFFDSPHKLSGG